MRFTVTYISWESDFDLFLDNFIAESHSYVLIYSFSTESLSLKGLGFLFSDSVRWG